MKMYVFISQSYVFAKFESCPFHPHPGNLSISLILHFRHSFDYAQEGTKTRRKVKLKHYPGSNHFPMKKFLHFSCAAIICASSLLCTHPAEKKEAHGDPMEDDAKQRLDWEFRRLAGPDGTIPVHMREKELAFAATLPSDIMINGSPVQ